MEKNDRLPSGWGSASKPQGWGASSGQKPAWGNPPSAPTPQQQPIPKKAIPAEPPKPILPQSQPAEQPKITESVAEIPVAPVQTFSVAQAKTETIVPPVAVETEPIPAAAPIGEVPAVPQAAEKPAETAPPIKESEVLRPRVLQGTAPKKRNLPVILLGGFLGLAVIVATIFAVLLFGGKTPAGTTDPTPGQVTRPTQEQPTTVPTQEQPTTTAPTEEQPTYPLPQEEHLKWLGPWQTTSDSDYELTIRYMDEDTVIFSIWRYRLAAVECIKAYPSNGWWEFEYDSYISGAFAGWLSFEENGIRLGIDTSTYNYLPASTWMFSQKPLGGRSGDSVYNPSKPWAAYVWIPTRGVSYYSDPGSEGMLLGQFPDMGIYQVTKTRQVSQPDGSTQTWVFVEEIWGEFGWIKVDSGDGTGFRLPNSPLQMSEVYGYSIIATETDRQDAALVLKVKNNSPAEIQALTLELGLYYEKGSRKTASFSVALPAFHRDLHLDFYFVDLSGVEEVLLEHGYYAP